TADCTAYASPFESSACTPPPGSEPSAHPGFSGFVLTTIELPPMTARSVLPSPLTSAVRKDGRFSVPTFRLIFSHVDAGKPVPLESPTTSRRASMILDPPLVKCVVSPWNCRSVLPSPLKSPDHSGVKSL